MIEINNFPLPPSVNGLYAHNGQRMVKSRVYREYEKNVYAWLVTNPVQVNGLREYARGLGDGVFSVDATFRMKRKAIVCLNGKPKKNDTSNRLKALHDVLSSIILGIDDSYFWSGSFTKEAIGDEEVEGVTLKFQIRSI